MQILIVDDPVVCGASESVNHYRKCIKSIAGQWIEVETEFLFKNQFNTPPGTGGSECGLKIHLRHVKEIKDDMRPYRKICRWCNHNSALVDKKCSHCGHDDYFERLMPKKKKLKHSLGEITFTESDPADAIR